MKFNINYNQSNMEETAEQQLCDKSTSTRKTNENGSRNEIKLPRVKHILTNCPLNTPK